MKNFDQESADLTGEKFPHFTHAGTIQDPSLHQLREQIKKVMIPLLIKTFQLKLELNQTLSLPSRIQNVKNQTSSEEIVEQLKQLDKDLKVLLLWCQSCRSQIQKALIIPEEEQRSTVAATDPHDANPAVSKSFSDAISQKSSTSSHSYTVDKPSPPDSQETETKKKWWRFLKIR